MKKSFILHVAILLTIVIPSCKNYPDESAMHDRAAEKYEERIADLEKRVSDLSEVAYEHVKEKSKLHERVMYLEGKIDDIQSLWTPFAPNLNRLEKRINYYTFEDQRLKGINMKADIDTLRSQVKGLEKVINPQ